MEIWRYQTYLIYRLHAFDSIDQRILLRRFKISYGLGGVVLQWFVSYTWVAVPSLSAVETTLRPL